MALLWPCTGSSRLTAGSRFNLCHFSCLSEMTPAQVQYVLQNCRSFTVMMHVTGRSIFLWDISGKAQACATIQPLTDIPMAEVVFTGCDSGKISFRQLSKNYLAVYSKMTFSCTGGSHGGRRLHLLRLGRVGADISKACEDAAAGSGGSSLKVLQEVRDGAGFFVLVGMTLEDIAAEQTALLLAADGATPSKCAPARLVAKRSVHVRISSRGVAGVVSFTQNSPFERTFISFDVSGLQRQGGPFHVHQYPVPELMAADDQLCSADAVAGHWNPFGVDMSRSPPSGTGTEDQYEIGDLSGKHGSWAGKDSATAANISDWNLPLFGPNRIVGRSFVIHNASYTAHRWVCADIGFPDFSVTAVAYFQYPVVGQVVMTQSPEEPFGETTLFAQLGYTGDETAYDTRRLAVTSARVGSDFDASQPLRCSSAGLMWNPTSAGSNAGDGCSLKNPYGCPVGEIAARGCEIRISPATGAWQKVFCTDVFLPLSGPFSVLGKSMTLYNRDNKTALACADIIREMPLVASVSQWVGPLKVHGNITMQDTETALTKLTIRIEGLQSKADTYSIHNQPIHVAASPNAVEGDFDCLSSAGSQYNPIQLPSSASTISGGSMDQFITGDLSGKHGSLAGLTAISLEAVDNNLPLSGTNSVVGRSIVVKDARGSALACGNLLYSTEAMGSRLIRAVANFTDLPGGEVTGYVMMTQAVHPDGAQTSTSVEIQLRYTNQSKKPTVKHSWHIHSNPLDDDDNSGGSTAACSSAGPHYNPFHRSASSASYSVLCNPYSSAMCELGDMSSKLGAYAISSGDIQVHTDVYLPLTGNFSVIGRSIVFQSQSDTSEMALCADILPVGQPTVLLRFPATKYSKPELIHAIATLLDIGAHDVAVQADRSYKGGRHHTCVQVRIYFSGFDADQLSRRLVKEAAMLGRFAPGPCSASRNSHAARLGNSNLQRIVIGLLAFHVLSSAR